MTEFLFPDNTVLCNFAAINHLDLLRSVLDERGRWTEAVAFEAKRSSKALPALSGLVNDPYLGEPIEISDEAEVLHVELIRRAVFGGTYAEPLRHLGEAQTCHVILNWKEFAGSWWISDDREALGYARFRGITTRETIDIVRMAVVNGDISAKSGFQVLQDMADCGRHVALPVTQADLML